MTNTKLKLSAMLFMVMDHLYAFGYGVPYWFHLIGRLAAPIFIFCCIEGFAHTHNKKSYIVRLYLLNVVMGILNFILPLNSDYNFVRSLLLIIILLYLRDKVVNGAKNAKRYLLVFIVWQICSYGIILTLSMGANVPYNVNMLLVNLSGSLGELDGGIFFIVMGCVMFIFKASPKKFVISYLALCFLYLALFNSNLMPFAMRTLENYETTQLTFSWVMELLFSVNPMLQSETGLIFGNPQWMMVFALPFMLLYNKSKGMGLKWLFYVFYPVHIILLFIIGSF